MCTSTSIIHPPTVQTATMPPSAKRTQRAKRDQPTQHSDEVDNQTSPAQSAKRRRTKAEVKEEDEAPRPLPLTQEELDMTPEELVIAVSNALNMPDYPVQVAEDHNNRHMSRQSKNVSAYAKIAGNNWTFYIKRLTTNIGRPPEGYVADVQTRDDYEGEITTAMANEGLGSTLPAEATEPSRIHVDLGPNKTVSRLHAEIFFDSDSSKWKLLVNGRNGAKVEGILVRRGESFELHNGAVIEIAGIEMLFILPEGDNLPKIGKQWLRKAGLIAQDPFHDPRAPPDGNFIAAANRGKAAGQFAGRPMLAPAPPDYRRPDTPAKRNARGPAVGASPYVGGTIVLNNEQIDYQDEATQHIKPAFTYGQLISQAIMSAENESATLNEIYEFMKRNYAHYRRPDFFKGWQNSIRHNLSLNAGFVVRQRGPEDTGKGGYWCFVPEVRDQMVADAWGPKQARKSPPKNRRSGSAQTPGNSPRANSKKSSTWDSKQGHNPGEADGGSPSRKVKRSPKTSPDMSAVPQKPLTPDRLQLPKPLDENDNASPLPRLRRPSNAFGISDNAAGSPILSSSFMPEEGAALMTPAPVKRHPHLAPPSTAQRPSQHMPTSSPAPFWRFAEMGAGSTPNVLGSVSKLGLGLGTSEGRGYDMSPLRGLGNDAGHALSSSPAPRRQRSVDASATESAKPEGESAEGGDGEKSDEEPTFDLTRGFMKISKFHSASAPGGPPGPVGTPSKASS